MSGKENKKERNVHNLVEEKREEGEDLSFIVFACNPFILGEVKIGVFLKYLNSVTPPLPPARQP